MQCRVQGLKFRNLSLACTCAACFGFARPAPHGGRRGWDATCFRHEELAIRIQPVKKSLELVLALYIWRVTRDQRWCVIAYDENAVTLGEHRTGEALCFRQRAAFRRQPYPVEQMQSRGDCRTPQGSPQR